MISVYIFTVAFFITYDFSIPLMHFTSELQTLPTFLFVNVNIKCGYAFSKLERDKCFGTKFLGFAKKSFIFIFSAPPFSVGVAYKSIK